MRPTLLTFYLLFAGCNHTYLEVEPLETQEWIDLAYTEALEQNALQNAFWPNGNFWQLFHDQQLSCLIAQTFANSPTLDLAESQLQEACAWIQKEQSIYYPHIDGGASYNFQQETRTGQFGRLLGFPTEFAQADLLFSLSWELDLWKKNRDKVAALLGQREAKAYDYWWTKLSLSLATTELYITWQLTYQTFFLTETMLSNRVAYLQLVEERRQNHLDDAFQLTEILEQIHRLEASLTNLALQLDTTQHALQALTSNFSLSLVPHTLDLETLTPLSLPCAATLDLLGRRPDIQSLVALIYASAKERDVAQKEFYPDLHLSALFGLSTIRLDQLFQPQSSDWGVNPALHLPLFRAGELEGNLSAYQQKYRQAVLTYNEQVLQATKEFLDALSSLEKRQEERMQLQNIYDLADYNLELHKKRQTYHLDSLLLTLNQEYIVLEKEQLLLQNSQEVLKAFLATVKAVGG